MRNIFVLLILSTILSSCMSLSPTPEQEKALEEIKDFTGLAKQDLYKKALTWVARTYNSANDVVQLKDPEAGQIICKGLGSVMVDVFYGNGYFAYTMILDIKDNKIRVRFENILSQSYGSKAAFAMDYHYSKVVDHFTKLKNRLFEAIQQSKIDENW